MFWIGGKVNCERAFESNGPIQAHYVLLLYLTRRDHEVVDFTRSHVKNYSELTNLGN